MNKDMNKKISSTIIKMIAIIVSIFVFSYAWFVHNEDTHINAIEIGTAKTNNIQVSEDGGNNWGTSLSIDVGEGFRFDNEVTSDGINFYKANLKNDDGYPLHFINATVNKDYLDFDLWFKNDTSVKLFLDDNSRVYPECGTDESDLIWDEVTGSLDSITRVSAYGNFSRDLIAGAVRVAFIKYNYDEENDEYILDNTPSLVWAPNPNYEIISNGEDLLTASITSTNKQSYKYLKVNSGSDFVESDIPNLVDTIHAKYSSKMANGDTPLVNIETTDGVEKKAGLKIRVWVEGNDRDANGALKGGIFKFDLSFIGLQKKDNTNIPNVSKNGNSISGINNTMEYSIDNGNEWIRYNGSDDLSFESGTHVLVRYSETSDYFVSNYVELDF